VLVDSQAEPERAITGSVDPPRHRLSRKTKSTRNSPPEVEDSFVLQPQDTSRKASTALQSEPSPPLLSQLEQELQEPPSSRYFAFSATHPSSTSSIPQENYQFSRSDRNLDFDGSLELPEDDISQQEVRDIIAFSAQTFSRGLIEVPDSQTVPEQIDSSVRIPQNSQELVLETPLKQVSTAYSHIVQSQVGIVHEERFEEVARETRGFGSRDQRPSNSGREQQGGPASSKILLRNVVPNSPVIIDLTIESIRPDIVSRDITTSLRRTKGNRLIVGRVSSLKGISSKTSNNSVVNCEVPDSIEEDSLIPSLSAPGTTSSSSQRPSQIILHSLRERCVTETSSVATQKLTQPLVQVDNKSGAGNSDSIEVLERLRKRVNKKGLPSTIEDTYQDLSLSSGHETISVHYSNTYSVCAKSSQSQALLSEDTHAATLLDTPESSQAANHHIGRDSRQVTTVETVSIDQNTKSESFAHIREVETNISSNLVSVSFQKAQSLDPPLGNILEQEGERLRSSGSLSPMSDTQSRFVLPTFDWGDSREIQRKQKETLRASKSFTPNTGTGVQPGIQKQTVSPLINSTAPIIQPVTLYPVATTNPKPSEADQLLSVEKTLEPTYRTTPFSQSQSLELVQDVQRTSEEDHIIACPLTDHQRDLYLRTIYNNYKHVLKYFGSKGSSQVQSSHSGVSSELIERCYNRLDSISTHPDLINDNIVVEDEIPDEATGQWNTEQSPKFAVLHKILESVRNKSSDIAIVGREGKCLVGYLY